MTGTPVAIVTGAAKGIGAAVAELLARQGMAVAVLDVDERAAKDTAARLSTGGIAVAVDVSDHAAVQTAVAVVESELGDVDVLVNNAGWDRMQPFVDNEPDLWDKLLAVNVRGVFNLSHVVVPGMLARGAGRIVNVASDAGRVGSSGEVAYSACKGAVIAFTKALAREVARGGVSVNSVCPGPTDTPLLRGMLEGATGERIVEGMRKATPMRRLAEPDEIAAAVQFFATGPEFVTGQTLSVSGGLTMAG